MQVRSREGTSTTRTLLLTPRPLRDEVKELELAAALTPARAPDDAPHYSDPRQWRRGDICLPNGEYVRGPSVRASERPRAVEAEPRQLLPTALLATAHAQHGASSSRASVRGGARGGGKARRGARDGASPRRPSADKPAAGGWWSSFEVLARESLEYGGDAIEWGACEVDLFGVSIALIDATPQELLQLNLRRINCEM